MYKIILWILVAKLQMATLQFPEHIDLQKVGEIKLNNEKYNILKPSKHIITDYFKEFILQRRTKNIPTKRIFMDHNGFRHYWSGINDKINSLRKTTTDIEANNEKVEDNKYTTKKPNEDMSDTENDDTQDAPEEVDDNAANNETNDNLSEAVDTNVEVTESATEKLTPKRKDISKHWSYYEPIVKRKETKLRQAKEINDPKKDSAKKEYTGNKIETAQNNRNIATTTFFCPFLGVMTMSAFAD